jgi:hypothetical protein
MDEGCQQEVSFKVDKLHLTKARLYGSTKRKLKETNMSHGNNCAFKNRGASAVLKELYTEEKRSEEKDGIFLVEKAEFFLSTPRKVILCLRSYTLEGGALVYVCANQRTAKWVIETLNGYC